MARRVIVTLGVREGQRELEAAEIVGALATQIQAVIAERYPRRSLSSAGRGTQPQPRQPAGEQRTADMTHEAEETAQCSAVESAGPGPGIRRNSAEAPPRVTVEDESETTPVAFNDTPRLALSANGQPH